MVRPRVPIVAVVPPRGLIIYLPIIIFTWEDAIHFNLSNCQMLTKLQVVDIMAYNLASPWFEGIFFFTNLGQLFSKFTKEIFIKLSYIFYP